MLTIGAYELEPVENQVIYAQPIERVLKIAVHKGRIKMWCLIDMEIQPRNYEILSLETGDCMDIVLHDRDAYLGTVLMPDDRVLHFWKNRYIRKR